MPKKKVVQNKEDVNDKYSKRITYYHVINGWNVPNGVSWEEFVRFRTELGLPCEPRKALFYKDLKEAKGVSYGVAEYENLGSGEA